MRSAIHARPLRSEVTGGRRIAVFGVVALIVAVTQITDAHTEACGPGHRSEAVVELIDRAISEQQPLEPGEISKAIENSTPGWVCGITYPTHAHDGHEWPEPQHIAGLLIYFFALLGLGLWAVKGFDKKQNNPKE